VPNRLFISGGGGKPGEGQPGGSVLETLLSLILSEKAGTNIQESEKTAKPLEEFIRQFTATPQADGGQQTRKSSATPETPSAAPSGKRSTSG